MSKKEAKTIVLNTKFQNDFERIKIIKLILSTVSGATLSDLNSFYNLSKFYESR